MFFKYLYLLFGLNNTICVLTKLLRCPSEKWRKEEITVVIHVYDGIRIMNEEK